MLTLDTTPAVSVTLTWSSGECFVFQLCWTNQFPRDKKNWHLSLKTSLSHFLAIFLEIQEIILLECIHCQGWKNSIAGTVITFILGILGLMQCQKSVLLITRYYPKSFPPTHPHTHKKNMFIALLTIYGLKFYQSRSDIK